MRKIAILAAGIVFVVAWAAGAQDNAAGGQSTGASEQGQSIDRIMSQIRSEQGLSPTGTIDPEKVSPKLLAQLGDAVMDVMVPNARQHQFMDQMMGGEGSSSLESAHEWMGYRYLAGQAYGWGYGMMGGMMGPGMMGGWGFRSPQGYSSPYQSPEDIARMRYARGEITREQYEQLMKDLGNMK